MSSDSADTGVLRLLGFTGIRSDFDLMARLYQELHQDPSVECGLVVSGTHLSARHGLTIRFVESSGLPIVARIDCLVDSDHAGARAESSAVLQQELVSVLQEWQPDALLIAGDREDALAVAIVGAYTRTPVVHFFGGDHASDGNVDNPVRHACSKLASLHFVSHPEHARRLRAIGEPEARIHLIGSPALDRFVATPPMSQHDVVAAMGADPGPYAVVIFHPLLGEEEQAGQQFAAILDALEKRDQRAFVSAPNSDAGHESILAVIDEREESPLFHFYGHVEDELFVNLLRHATVLIGNSSAGILEAPAIQLAAVNVGSRQRGRRHDGNVVFVAPEPASIIEGLECVESSAFQKKLQTIRSSYGDGASVARAHRLLLELDLKSFAAKPDDPIALWSERHDSSDT